LLSENGYATENRINPKVGQQTTTKAYSTYQVRKTLPELEMNQQSGRTVKLQPMSTSISLPEGILIALSCPLTAKKTGETKLMKDPVTLVKDGITYERATLLEEHPSLQEGKDFYPNIKLRTIINYVAANSLNPEEYLAKLQKVEEDILDPILQTELINPVLSPSGYSYEKSSIEKWISTKQSSTFLSNNIPVPDPVTKEDIKGRPMPENVNLRLLIKAWPSFYEQQKENLQHTVQSSSKIPASN
jgi:hypothetical protein